jgi:hypothetical protein
VETPFLGKMSDKGKGNSDERVRREGGKREGRVHSPMRRVYSTPQRDVTATQGRQKKTVSPGLVEPPLGYMVEKHSFSTRGLQLFHSTSSSPIPPLLLASFV